MISTAFSLASSSPFFSAQRKHFGVELFPISKDALSGPRNLINLAVVYAWTNELDAAFATLGSLTKTPFGIYYRQLKLDPIWDPLRKDPRFDRLLAELAPRD